MKLFLWLFFSTPLAVVIGCAEAERPLGMVTGRVTQDGEPVGNLCLEFHPTSGGRPSLAITNHNGEFTAIYLENVPGAKLGQHFIRYELAHPDPVGDATPEEFLALGRRSLGEGVRMVPT